MMDSTIIRFADVSFGYNEHRVLHDLSLSVNSGEFICLTGKSGCGKSTLLRLMNGLLISNEGTIEILGQPIETWDLHLLRRKMGYVFQAGALFPHLTAYQNMCYCMKMNGSDENECIKRINELLPLMNLNREVLQKFPDQLSGGQKQRVGILRAIAHNPKIVLMDEPFSALDEETRMNLQELVKRIHKQFKTTFIMVTHSKAEAEKLGTRVVHMGRGKIENMSVN